MLAQLGAVLLELDLPGDFLLVLAGPIDFASRFILYLNELDLFHDDILSRGPTSAFGQSNISYNDKYRKFRHKMP